MKSIEIMKNKFKELIRSLELIIAGSKMHNTIDLDWLQGGILNMICRKASILLKKDKVKIDSLERWIRFMLINRKKKILVITICRIL